MKALLERLHIEAINDGACTGMDGWIHGEGPILTSYNPTNGEPIAGVRQAAPEVYDRVIEHARGRFDTWRTIPAPKRGDMVRDLGNILREHKEPLGELVSLEMGKIRVEGMGEVQEMIDICDFAVGLSRQLYGLTIASERPSHRMSEQWHPLGVTAVITAFNFPVAVWSWNASLASVCGDVTVWKPSGQTPLTAVAVQHLCNRVMADHGVDGVFNLAIGRGSDVGNLMLDDGRIPLVSFTGSTATGKAVASRVASPVRTHHPGTGRKQRDHRHRKRRPGACRAQYRLRRRGDGRATLHLHPPRHRTQEPDADADRSTGPRLCAGAHGRSRR